MAHGKGSYSRPAEHGSALTQALSLIGADDLGYLG